MAHDLKNKLVVITGGAEGIGHEIALNYLEKGAKIVILLDINENKGKEAANTLNAKYGKERAVFYKCDVTTDLEAIYKTIINAYKQIDVLVNNAGIFNDLMPRKTININVTAVIEWSLKFWEHMRKDNAGKGGTIINLASIYGFRIDPYLPVYQASKFAVYGFTKSLGHEENFSKSGVRVVAICPGFTETKLTEAPGAWNYQQDLKTFVKKQAWQKVDVVGKAAVEIYERAPTGTAWLIEGSRPIIQV